MRAETGPQSRGKVPRKRMGTETKYDACVIDTPNSSENWPNEGITAAALYAAESAPARVSEMRETHEKGPIMAWNATCRRSACLRHQAQL